MSRPKQILAAGEQRFELEVQKTADERRAVVAVGDHTFEVQVEPLSAERSLLICDGQRLIVHHARDGAALCLQLEGRVFRFEPVRRGAGRGLGGGGDISAPMPGAISRIMVVVGDRIAPKTPLYGLEAMKMESVVEAPYAAMVVAINAAVGDQVEGGAEVIRLERIEESAEDRA